MAGRSEKITKRAVDSAKPEAKLYRLWDSELKGFGLKVLPSGVKTYIVVYRGNGGGRGAPLKEYTIGRHGPLTPDEARKAAEIKLGTVRLGGDPQTERQKARAEMTVADLCGLYLKEGADHKKPSTLKSDGYRINSHVIPLLGQKRVSEVTGVDVERFVRAVATGSHAKRKPSKKEAAGTDVATRGRKDANTRGGKGTATRTLITLSGIFRWAMKPGRRYREDNPCVGVDKFPSRKSERFLSAAELLKLGDALAGSTANPQALSIIRLLILTGARKGEIEGLRWSEVNFNLSCLYLADSKTGQRLIPLGAPALAVIEALPRDPVSPYVFPATGNPARNFIGTPRVWEGIREAAGLQEVRLHDLRHTFASLAAGGGQSLPMIGKILGHADVKTTARYAHLADDPVKVAVNRISEAAAAALAGKSGEVIPIASAKRSRPPAR